MLTNLYRNGGLSKRICNLIPEDAARNWFRISNDEDDKVKQHLEVLGAQEKITRGWQMGRLYGGSIVLMGIDDGKDLTEPVDEKRIRSVNGLIVFDRRDVHVQASDIERDLKSGRFGEPNKYRIMPLLGGEQFDVHASRCLRFDGDTLGWREYQAGGYFHDSVLQTAWEAIRQWAAVLDSAEFITEQFVINTIKFEGLMQALASKDGEDLLKKRITMLDQSMHVANHVLLDANEEYTKTTASVAGLPQLVQQFMMALGAATGYPLTLLFGRSPAGQNATGESDIQFYYDRVRSLQTTLLRPRIETLIKYIFASKGFKAPESWSIQFNPLKQVSPEELASLYKSVAEGDQLNITNDILSPEAIAKHRYVGDEYNPSPPTITEEEFEEEQKLREEQAAQQLEMMKAQGAAADNGEGDDDDEPPEDSEEKEAAD
jgi:phage-related protein (TIGR01555 family)